MAAILVIAALPAAAQDAPLVVRIVYDTTINRPPFTEGSAGPLYKAKIKDGGVAPRGGLTIRVSWIVTATGTTGQSISPRPPLTIPEGANESPLFAAWPIPDDTAFHPCNRIVTILESINPAVYRIAPYVQGEGFHSVVYADASPGMQSPSC